MNEVAFDLLTEAGFRDHRSAKDREAPGQTKEFSRERNRTHRSMAKAEPKRSPFSKPRGTFYDAVFVCSDCRNSRRESEDRQHALEQTGLQHRVAVENDHHAIIVQAAARDFFHACAECETFAFVTAIKHEFWRPMHRVRWFQLARALF